jgi:ADP-dependent NAD(P)H-hydrate dehydratase
MTGKTGKSGSVHRLRQIDDALLRRWPLPRVHGDQGKDDRGRVLVVGGSRQIPGAAILAAVASLRAGAGKLQIATSRSVATAVAVSVPEALVLGIPETSRGEIAASGCRALHEHIQRVDALLIGPGMMDARAGVRLLRHCVAGGTDAVLVVDAAPLAAFAGRKPLPHRHRPGIVLTPHAGEMAKLWGVKREEVVRHALAMAREASAQLDAVIVLKGARTWIVAPDGSAFRNTAGNVGLGTSGSGDTLAGLIVGLCARGATPLQAAVWGVYLHARAAESLAEKLGVFGFLARELPSEIPALLAGFS